MSAVNSKSSVPDRLDAAWQAMRRRLPLRNVRLELGERGEPATDWEFAAAHRLGAHWQAMGDYLRAEAAYRQALALRNDHAPSVYNLAVVRVRLGAYDAAWETLDRMWPPEPPARKTWTASLYPVAYHRALIEDYRESPPKAALRWSHPLAEELLSPDEAEAAKTPDRVSAQLRLPALVLHAGILIRTDDMETLIAAAAATLGAGKRYRLSLDDPASIVAYVRENAGDDTRTHYNLACFIGRLAEQLPARANDLFRAAAASTERALADPKLLPWAKRDPSLATMHESEEWQAVLKRFEPTDDERTRAEAETSATATATAPLSPAALRVKHDREHLVDATQQILEEVYLDELAPRTVEGFAALRGAVQTLRPGNFQMRLAAIVASLDDPATLYRLPAEEPSLVHFVPFTIEECAEPSGRARFVVASASDGPPVGSTVLHWNGVPIERAVQLRADRIGAGSLAARRARALASLTHRPAGLLSPFAEDEVVVGYRLTDERDVRDGLELRVEWEQTVIPSLSWHPEALVAVDPLVDAITRARDVAAPGKSGRPTPAFDLPYARLSSFAPKAVYELESHLAEPGFSAGVVLDVRGNPGGSLMEMERLLAWLVKGPVEPLCFEVRASERTEAIAGRHTSLRDWTQPIARACHEGQRTVRVPAATRRVGPSPGPPPRSVVLLIDAFCGGATDTFIARFADHRVGPVLATARHTGATGSLSVVADPRDFLAESLRTPADWGLFEITVARALRGSKHAGRTLEGSPLVSDRVHTRTLRDVLSDDADLLEVAAKLLADWRGG